MSSKSNVPGSTANSTGVVSTVINAATQDSEGGSMNNIIAVHNEII